MFRATNIPGFSSLLEGLATRDHKAIAKHLDVTEKTLQRYIREDRAPKPVMLALYFETHHAVRDLHTDAFNDARREANSRAMADSTIRDLRARIAYLEGLAAFGSANDPTMRPESRPYAAQPLYEGPHGRTVAVGSKLPADRYWA